MNTIQQLFIMTKVKLPAYSAENKMCDHEFEVVEMRMVYPKYVISVCINCDEEEVQVS